MIITTLEMVIDHFVENDDIDRIHGIIHRTLDPRTGSRNDALFDAGEKLLTELVPEVPDPELIAPGARGYWVAYHGCFIGVPYNETEWPRNYILHCCVHTAMSRVADEWRLGLQLLTWVGVFASYVRSELKKRGPVCNANLGQRWASGPVFWAIT